MVKKIKTFLLVMLAVTVVIPVVSVSAQSEEATTKTEATTQDATTLQTTATTTETPAATDRSSGREERVKAYKEKLQSKLTAVKEKRIVARCKAAQEKVTALRTRMQTAISNRKQAYASIGERLDTAIEKLKKASIDTTALEAAREDIKADLTTLDENLNAYDTVLADLEEMDCVADPATFQAALESARETQKSLREQAQKFRLYASNELKTILEEMKTKLAQKTETTTQATTEGGAQ